MTQDKQIAIRIPSQWWDVLQGQAEVEITDAPKRPGPTGKTAQFIRQLILEGMQRRNLLTNGDEEGKLSRKGEIMIEAMTNSIIYDGRVAPVVGPPGKKNVGYEPELGIIAAVEGYYPYGQPEIVDQRGIDSSSLSVLYGSGGVGTKLLPGDFDIVRDFYKFEMDFSKGYDAVLNGDYFWGIFQIEIKEGPSILQPQVYDFAGVKLTYQNILVFMTWPDCPDTFPPGVTPQYGPGKGVNFTGQGIFGQTEGHGDVGFGTSGGSHIGPDGGAFTIWLASDNDPAGARKGSDAIHKVGWFDNHIHPNPRFKVMQKGGVTPPPVTTGNRLVVYVNGEPVLYFVGSEAGNQNNGMFLEDAEGNKSLFFPGFQI